MIGKGLATPSSGSAILTEGTPIVVHSVHFYAGASPSTTSWFADSNTNPQLMQLKGNSANKSLDFGDHGVIFPNGLYILKGGSDVLTLGFEKYPGNGKEPYNIASLTVDGTVVASGQALILGGIVLTSKVGGATTVSIYHGTSAGDPLVMKLTCAASDTAIHMCPAGVSYPNGLFVDLDSNTNAVYAFYRIP